MISVVIISKDEETLDDTLSEVTAQARALNAPSEIVVVDASEGRLDHIRQRHEGEVRWVQFERPPGVRVSIPHQRNVGVRAAHGDMIVFTDAGCWPDAGWLARLVSPVREDEQVTAGLTLAARERNGLYDRKAQQASEAKYLRECSTINLAFRRVVFDEVGGFDEKFAYGSDVDFSWRLVDAGYRIRSVPEAIIRHDWGTRRRQLRRSYIYGKARMRLYRKHRERLRRIPLSDPMMIAYPAFLLGLPLTVVFHFYPALLIIPAWRNRHDGAVRVLVDHLAYGVGILVELVAP